MATYTAPTTRTTGALISASIWNTDIVENLKYFKDAPVFDGDISVGDDLFLTSTGAVINFASGDVTVTHGTNSLTFAGAASGYIFNDGNVGIGVTPNYRLQVQSSGTGTTAASNIVGRFQTNGSGYDVFVQFSDNVANSGGIGMVGGAMYLANGTTRNLTLDSSGNVGLGVTPSAWSSSFKAIESAGSSGVVLASANVNPVYLGSNWYSDGTNRYKTTAAATLYEVGAGTFKWYTAPSGTAGNAITFTERMQITSGGDVAIAATAKLYLDGTAATGDTYIQESSANRIDIVTANSVAIRASNTVGVQIFPATGGVPLLDSTGYAMTTWPTTASAANAHVANGNYIRLSTSSNRWKHDIATLDTTDALSAVMAMRPVTYRGKTDEDQRRHVGFIAEEMQQVAPLLCTYDEGGESGTPNYVTYDRVTAYLVAVVQQQQQKIAALEARIH